MAILTVYTKLLNKSLDGARIIDMGSTKTCECFVLPFEQIKDVCNSYNEMTQYAFYILLGKDESGRQKAYIGQTNGFNVRYLDHMYKKDWWDTALVFISKANEIFSSEVLYLEYLGWKTACEASNFVIANTKPIHEPSLSQDKKNDMVLFFEEIMFLTRFYGCEVFETPLKEQLIPKDCIEFFIDRNKKGIHGCIHYFASEKKYILKAGSTIAAQTSSANSEAMTIREKIKADKNISQKDGDIFHILTDIDITGKSFLPSGPASVITGTSMQGTEELKDKEGKMFIEYFPKEH